MAILIQNGDVFIPESFGKADLLIVGDSVEKMGAVNREALAELDLKTDYIDARVVLSFLV